VLGKDGWKDTSDVPAFVGHTRGILSVAFSPDGTKVLTGSEDKTAKLWEVATGKEKHSFTGHMEPVTCVAFSPDGTKVLTGSRDKTAKLWDATTGVEVRTFAGQRDFVQSVAFSTDGSKVLVGAGNWSAKLWEAATGAAIGESLVGAADATVTAFSPDGTKVLTGGSLPRTKILTWKGWVDNSDSMVATARLWDVATGEAIRTFTGPTGGVSSVAFSPDGRRVITAARSVRTNARTADGWVDTEDNTARVWDVATGAEVRVLTGHTGEVTSVAFSPDGTRVLTGSKDSTARLWDAATGATIYIYNTWFTRPDGQSEGVPFVTFSPDGTKVLAVTEHGTVGLWDARPTDAHVLEKDGGAVRKPVEH
jgi:WD40 repeat protein